MRLLAQIGMKLDVLDDAEFLLESVLELEPGLSRRALRLRRSCSPQRHKHAQALEEIAQAPAARARQPRVSHDPRQRPGGSRRARGGAAHLPGAARRTRPTRPICTCRSRMRSRHSAGSPRRSSPTARPRRCSRLRRCVLEPREPQDLPVHGRARSSACARRKPRRPLARRPLSPVLRARQGARGRARVRRVLPLLRARQRAEEAESRYQPECIGAHAAHAGAGVHAGVLRGAPGCGLRPAPDPIFIVGLPRSGSTLLEQILASHSQVEGTMELADIPRLVQRAQRPRAGRSKPRYPACSPS